MALSDVNLVAVCGPTASGKTRLGVAVARRLGGEIISVDSRQVYRGLDLGAGKDPREYGDGPERVPCHLIDIAEPTEVYSLWRFQSDFYGALRDVLGRGRLPVAVGGTGLYLEAVLKGYRVPNVPEDPALRQRLTTRDKAELEAMLRHEAPELAEHTDMSSKQRIVRALEVAAYAREHDLRSGLDNPPPLRPLILGVRWERATLHERIRERLDQRLAAGMVDEVRGLLGRGVTRQRLHSLGLEYRHLAAFLAGETDLATMRGRLYTDICRFAKRQETYFRGMERRGLTIHWIRDADPAEAFALLERLGATC